jgi:predicted RNase H-like HicB family nuclease
MKACFEGVIGRDPQPMLSDKKLLVTARWDSEAKVWVATSDDIPGLVTEAESLDALVQRVLDVTPELLDDNAHLLEGADDLRDLLAVCVITELQHKAVAHTH